MSDSSGGTAIDALLREGPRVVNVGIRDFADTLVAQEAPVVHVEWSPPPQLDEDLADLLEVLG